MGANMSGAKLWERNWGSEVVGSEVSRYRIKVPLLLKG